MRGKKCIQNARGICQALFEQHFGQAFMLWDDNRELISIGKSVACNTPLLIMPPLIYIIHFDK
jgi:hypothetical protein